MNTMPPQRALSRFQRKVDRSAGPRACHPWRGSVSKAGYGMFCVRKNMMLAAHRFAWWADTFELPAPKDDVVSICGNRLCCNSAHLRYVPFPTPEERFWKFV